MRCFTIYLSDGEKVKVCGNSIEIDDNFITIFNQRNKMVAKFKWAYMAGFSYQISFRKE